MSSPMKTFSTCKAIHWSVGRYVRTFSNEQFPKRFPEEAVNSNAKPSATATVAVGPKFGDFSRQQWTMPPHIRQQYVERTTPMGDSSPAGELLEIPPHMRSATRASSMKRVIRNYMKQGDEPPMRADEVHSEQLFKRKDIDERSYAQTWEDFPKDSAIKSSAPGPKYFNEAGRRPTNKY